MLGHDAGRQNTENNACVDRRLGTRPCQGDALECKFSGGSDRDASRRADRTQKMARVLTPGLGPDLARVAHLDASFLGKGYGLDRLLVWGGFPKGGCLW